MKVFKAKSFEHMRKLVESGKVSPDDLIIFDESGQFIDKAGNMVNKIRRFYEKRELNKVKL